jgi:hypothetical protein
LALLISTTIVASEPAPYDGRQQVQVEAKLLVLIGEGARELTYDLAGSRWGRSQPRDGEQIEDLPETGPKWISLLVDHSLTNVFDEYVTGQAPFARARIRVVSYGNPVPVTYDLERATPYKVNRRTHHTLVQIEFESVTRREETEVP